jgi:RNA polymerase sigma-70 factor (ECF subfamily)
VHDNGLVVDPSVTFLLEAAAAGDTAALGEFVRRTEGRVRRACAHLGPRGEADDLTQETYLRALTALGRFRSESSAEVWLLAIARNVCADHVRKKVTRSEIDQRFRPGRPRVEHLGSGIESTDLLDRLDPSRRDAFVLTQLLDLSYEEAAEVCGCPVGTIRSRVARARSELIGMLNPAEDLTG